MSKCRFGGDNTLSCANKFSRKKMTFFRVFIIMNRSYSKIRHIQETNQRLEGRLISEQVPVSGGTPNTQYMAREQSFVSLVHVELI
jgi:hypothetical protein